VLVFTKTGAGGTDQVWFYDMKADGFSLDDKRSETKENDIPDIIARFRSIKAPLPEGGGAERRGESVPDMTPSVTSVSTGDSSLNEGARARTEQSFFVPKDEIVANDYDLSINKYKQTEYKPVEYPPTSEILANIKALEAEIGKELAELEAMLGKTN
jgi:type I restriction enzyme M protein